MTPALVSRPPGPQASESPEPSAAVISSRAAPCGYRREAVPVLIASIRRDGGTQIRAALDEATIARYVEALNAGEKLPAVTVWFDGKANWLSDGFHRIEAELRRGTKRIQADVRKGSLRAAIYDACGANAKHGLPRSNADKRRAVETLLADADWSTRTDRMLAETAGVSHTYVAEVRKSIRLTQGASGNVATAQGVKDSGPGRVKADAGMASGSGDEGVEFRDELPVSGLAAPESRGSTPSIDLLGLDDIDSAWLALVSDIEAALGAFDNHLRQAQASVCDLLGRPGLGAQLQALRRDAHELAARARKSVRPHSVCVYCKDPDGTAGRREECNGCRGLGYVTEEQMGAVPSELKTGGAAAKVIDQKAGGYVPRARKLKVELVDEAGASEPFEDGGF